MRLDRLVLLVRLVDPPLCRACVPVGLGLRLGEQLVRLGLGLGNDVIGVFLGAADQLLGVIVGVPPGLLGLRARLCCPLLGRRGALLGLGDHPLRGSLGGRQALCLLPLGLRPAPCVLGVPLGLRHAALRPAL